MLNFLLQLIAITAVIMLAPSVRRLAASLHVPTWVRHGLWGSWWYVIVVIASYALGLFVTSLTGSLYIIFSVMIFAFPLGFISPLERCLLNGFDVYYPECDIFPGAGVTIFLLNAAFYFAVGVVVGVIAKARKDLRV